MKKPFNELWNPVVYFKYYNLMDGGTTAFIPNDHNLPLSDFKVQVGEIFELSGNGHLDPFQRNLLYDYLKHDLFKKIKACTHWEELRALKIILSTPEQLISITDNFKLDASTRYSSEFFSLEENQFVAELSDKEAWDHIQSFKLDVCNWLESQVNHHVKKWLRANLPQKWLQTEFAKKESLLMLAEEDKNVITNQFNLPNHFNDRQRERWVAELHRNLTNAGLVNSSYTAFISVFGLRENQAGHKIHWVGPKNKLYFLFKAIPSAACINGKQQFFQNYFLIDGSPEHYSMLKRNNDVPADKVYVSFINKHFGRLALPDSHS